MIKNLTTVSTPRATWLCACASMPALHTLGSGTGVSIEGQTVVGSYVTAARVPAFLKDTVMGVRAWSPPV
jgi:hypothetical protein